MMSFDPVARHTGFQGFEDELFRIGTTINRLAGNHLRHGVSKVESKNQGNVVIGFNPVSLLKSLIMVNFTTSANKQPDSQTDLTEIQ